MENVVELAFSAGVHLHAAAVERDRRDAASARHHVTTGYAFAIRTGRVDAEAAEYLMTKCRGAAADLIGAGLLTEVDAGQLPQLAMRTLRWANPDKFPPA